MWFAALGWALTTLCLPEVINIFTDVDYSVPMVATMRAINGAFQGISSTDFVISPLINNLKQKIRFVNLNI